MHGVDSPLRPEESRALNVIAQHLDVEVAPHPERSRSEGQPDLRVTMRDGTVCDMEVTRDLSATVAARFQAVHAKQDLRRIPGLRLCWTVTYRIGEANIARVWGVAPALCRNLEASGATGANYETLLGGVPPGLAEARHAGIQSLTSFEPEDPNLFGAISLTTTWGGVTPQGLDHVAAWCEEVLSDEKYEDVVRKLRSSTANRREVYLVATQFPTHEEHFGVFWALSDGSDGLPVVAPKLPDGIDGVWVDGGSRVVRFARETGWHDATPKSAH
jgi:hypothetical protein